ncbi:MAG TPA: C4-dicarboxylate ABC transporter substrate-binding protein, partial [Tianweitania sediminis]|nr:C4-dicarboxylate ABC transporter substrate-binding protein [Tianweitania sediminis]
IQKIVDENTVAIIDAYAELDDKYMKDLQGTKVPVKTVDRAWFGPAIDTFYETWRQKAPALAEFEAEAKSN